LLPVKYTRAVTVPVVTAGAVRPAGAVAQLGWVPAISTRAGAAGDAVAVWSPTAASAAAATAATLERPAQCEIEDLRVIQSSLL
jgi:hypothetical protein